MRRCACSMKTTSATRATTTAEQYRTSGAETPGAGSVEPSRNKTTTPSVKISFLRRSGVLNARVKPVSLATAP
jgi:hypothetical protein